jgi:hypothetical protein
MTRKQINKVLDRIQPQETYVAHTLHIEEVSLTLTCSYIQLHQFSQIITVIDVSC